MEGFNSISRFQFSESIQELYLLSRQLHNFLNSLEQDVQNERLSVHLQSAIRFTHRLSSLSLELTHTQTFSLLAEEYRAFCDFIICGSEMATYLAEHKMVKKTMSNHARYWLKLLQKFKPFLKGAINQIAQSNGS